MFKKSLFILFILFPIFLFSQSTFEGKVVLRVNGHEHQLPDVFADEFSKIWIEHKSKIEKTIFYLVINRND